MSDSGDDSNQVGPTIGCCPREWVALVRLFDVDEPSDFRDADLRAQLHSVLRQFADEIERRDEAEVREDEELARRDAEEERSWLDAHPDEAAAAAEEERVERADLVVDDFDGLGDALRDDRPKKGQ